MKLFFREHYRFILLFIITLVTTHLFAEDLSLQQGLLWQISKPGSTPSYLFGTIHSEDTRVNQLPALVNSFFEQADSASFELLMDIPTLLKSASAMFFTGEQSLEQILDEDLYNQVINALNQQGMPANVAKRLKPWAVIAMLNAPPTKTGEFLDLLLYKKAQQLKMPTYGLEKVEEQLRVFEGLSLEEQVILLRETLAQFEQMPRIFDKLHELYLQRNLTALMQFSTEYMQPNHSPHEKLVKNFYKKLVDDRNVKMVKRMQKRLQEGNAFIAVGALHLPGKNGIIKLLQAQGYQVLALY
ncbi:MAG: TraB/GumN family protein [Thioploca sp.]|nr:TraB/GumN family protein [Thioploca sp.]